MAEPYGVGMAIISFADCFTDEHFLIVDANLCRDPVANFFANLYLDFLDDLLDLPFHFLDAPLGVTLV